MPGERDMMKEKDKKKKQGENFLKPQGDFETRIALVIAFSMIILGIFYGKF